ncbi:mitochondrial potassium channel ATP-binding subunit isoform X1 [Diorhabda sublineata]|uniref:mitochondrial potassium channel ATP-binding subunit isoform X1 n=1 Tax=Diorhabda sublineata TaxID=1163346 RepID=UPI0024E0A1D4|nr:mitochondrial potassium channel ATP-binding subunit isoform X1 [Diorhabda sublineata]
MWKLLQNNLHNKLLSHRNTLVWLSKPANIKNILSKPKHSGAQTRRFYLTTFGVTLPGSLIIKVHLSRNVVLCEAKKTRMVGYENPSERNAKFDWIRLWTYLRPHIWYFIAAVVGALVVALLNIQIPQVLGGVVNVLSKFNESKDTQLFIADMKKPAFKLIGMYIAQSASTFFYISMLSSLGEKMAYRMRADLFESIVKQDIAFFDQQRTGEIINRLTTDVQDFKSSFKQTVSGGLRAATQIVGCSVTLVMISPQMTLVSLLCIPSVIAVGTIFGTLLRSISRKAQAQIEKTTAVADEAVSNIRTVRAFAMEDQEIQLFNSEAELAKSLSIDLGLGIGFFQAGTNMFINGMVLSTLYMGGYLLATNQLSAGEVMAYLMASQTIQRSLAQISLLFGSVVRGVAAGSRVFEYINKMPNMSLKGGDILPNELIKGDIEFKNVYFAYPTRSQQMILQEFNLKIPAGKTIAIVGASGNGKSTIVSLLERFYDVKDGCITIDGYDIRNLDPSWLRGKILGLISQEPILFGTSIMENIRYGKPDATDEEVKQAALLANADDFITNFPLGYNTPVGERGVTLSGGQKQRIAIARALLKNPAVLLLDEATSALDSESENIVLSALEKARKGRTVIVIAHRLSTIQNADLIVVLNKGKIVEMGTHEELKKLGGYYWSLVYQQQNSPAG